MLALASFALSSNRAHQHGYPSWEEMLHGKRRLSNLEGHLAQHKWYVHKKGVPIVRSREPTAMRPAWSPSAGSVHDRSACRRTAVAKLFSGTSAVVAKKQTSVA
jgi:hypothetical protein